jgi:hypothetical protein
MKSFKLCKVNKQVGVISATPCPRGAAGVEVQGSEGSPGTTVRGVGSGAMVFQGRRGACRRGQRGVRGRWPGRAGSQGRQRRLAETKRLSRMGVHRWIVFFAKQHRRRRGMAGRFSQNTPPFSVAIRSRSGGSYRSFHSFHRWAGFHLIRSRGKLAIGIRFLSA